MPYSVASAVLYEKHQHDHQPYRQTVCTEMKVAFMPSTSAYLKVDPIFPQLCPPPYSMVTAIDQTGVGIFQRVDPVTGLQWLWWKRSSLSLCRSVTAANVLPDPARSSCIDNWLCSDTLPLCLLWSVPTVTDTLVSLNSHRHTGLSQQSPTHWSLPTVTDTLVSPNTH